MRIPQIISAAPIRGLTQRLIRPTRWTPRKLWPGSGGQLIRVRLRNFSGRRVKASWATIAANEYPTTCAGPSSASSMAIRSLVNKS